MKTFAMVLTLLVVLPLGTAFAQEEGEKREPFDMEGAIRKVNELLKESERLLVGSLRPGASPGETAEKMEAARKALDDMLGESRKSGQEASKLMGDIVKNAPRKPGGGGGDDQDHKPKDDPKEQPGDEDEVDEKDPQNSKKGEPEPNEKQKDEPVTDPKKPVSEKDKPADPDLAREWLATLPPEVRKAFENRDWDSIPPKWREKIRKYMKELAETDSGE